MEEERSVRWILVVSLALTVIVTWLGPYFWGGYYYPMSELEKVVSRFLFYINRIDTVFFVATLAAASLFSSGFGNKVLMLKISAYLFIMSMTLFSITVLGSLLFYR